MPFFDIVNHQMQLSTSEMCEILSSLNLQIRKFTELKIQSEEIVIQDICTNRLDILQPLYDALNKVYLNDFDFTLKSRSYE